MRVSAIILTPSSLFNPCHVPDSVMHINETTRGYTVQANDPSFLRALLSYHSALGAWPLQQASPFHAIIPTSLEGQGYSDLDPGKSQVISCLTTVDGTGSTNTVFPNEKNSPSVIGSTTFEGYTIHALDQALGIPGQYNFEYSNSQLFGFEDLRVAIGAEEFEDLEGFTVFAPNNNGAFFNEAQSRFPTTQLLTSLFNNHVRILVYSSSLYVLILLKRSYMARQCGPQISRTGRIPPNPVTITRFLPPQTGTSLFLSTILPLRLPPPMCLCRTVSYTCLPTRFGTLRLILLRLRAHRAFSQ